MNNAPKVLTINDIGIGNFTNVTNRQILAAIVELPFSHRLRWLFFACHNAKWPAQGPTVSRWIDD